MGETVEKIYCCDRGDNDNALAAAILAGNNRRDDWGPMAAMMGGGMNNWMNNPFAYLMFLAALFRNGGFGFGDGNGAGVATQGIETQAQLNAIRTQQDKCDILRAGQDNTQRIIDTLNNHWSDEKSLQIQDLKFQLSQKEQNEKFAAMLYGSRNGNNYGCGCGNSCGCGCGCGQ